jgi:hypothetical protein
MKRAIFLASIIFVAGSFFANCSKQDGDTDVDEGLITLADLEGTWNFVSYNFGGTEYNCSTFGLPENMNRGFANLTFNNVAMTALRVNDCYVHSVELDFTKDKNTISFNGLGYVNNDIYYTFTVMSCDGNQLKLRLDKMPVIYNYLGGTMTLMK